MEAAATRGRLGPSSRCHCVLRAAVSSVVSLFTTHATLKILARRPRVVPLCAYVNSGHVLNALRRGMCAELLLRVEAGALVASPVTLRVVATDTEQVRAELGLRLALTDVKVRRPPARGPGQRPHSRAGHSVDAVVRGLPQTLHTQSRGPALYACAV
jgi:hypothetical protein